MGAVVLTGGAVALTGGAVALTSRVAECYPGCFQVAHQRGHSVQALDSSSLVGASGHLRGGGGGGGGEGARVRE